MVRAVKVNQLEDPYRLYAADGGNLPLYAPVDWLIDKTPLKEPLLWWAHVWGVEEDFWFANAIRGGAHFSIDPPPGFIP
jgi:hypothetical protein